MTIQHQDIVASSAPSNGSKTTSRAVMITKRARLIFSAYPRDEFADPDMFVLQLGMVLERYPDDVIIEISDPLTGIQRRSKKVPSLAHIVEACEDALERRPKPELVEIEPPVDPVMQARVGKLLTDLAVKLRDEQREARAEKIREMADDTKRRRRARGQQDHPSPSPELAAIVENWQREAAE